MTLAKRIPVMALLAFMLGCASEPDTAARSFPTTWVVSEGLCEPETVIHDQVTDRLIVSNICGFKKNGEGYLSVLARDGTPETLRWIDGLDAPAGMAVHGRKLYVTDLDKVQIVDLDAGVNIETIGPFPGAKAFNDIAIDGDGTVYVTDSARHRIIKFTGKAPAPYPDDEARFTYANGLHIDGGDLYVGGEKLWKIVLGTGDTQEIAINGLVDIDGIETDGRKGLTVSIVGGNVWHLPANGNPEIWTAPGVSSTNHAYIPADDLVIVPTGYDNTIVAFQVKH